MAVAVAMPHPRTLNIELICELFLLEWARS